MALENAEVLSELKERYTTIVEQLNELSNTRVKTVSYTHLTLPTILLV